MGWDRRKSFEIEENKNNYLAQAEKEHISTFRTGFNWSVEALDYSQFRLENDLIVNRLKVFGNPFAGLIKNVQSFDCIGVAIAEK